MSVQPHKLELIPSLLRVAPEGSDDGAVQAEQALLLMKKPLLHLEIVQRLDTTLPIHTVVSQVSTLASLAQSLPHEVAPVVPHVVVRSEQVVFPPAHGEHEVLRSCALLYEPVIQASQVAGLGEVL